MVEYLHKECIWFESLEIYLLIIKDFPRLFNYFILLSLDVSYDHVIFDKVITINSINDDIIKHLVASPTITL